MDWLQPVLEAIGSGLFYALLVLLCVAGFVLSGLSFSGPWFVVAAAGVAALVRSDPFPGWWTLIVFVLISAATEVFEFLASGWGVTRRGGSKWAGVAAMAGGFAGLFLGAWIPVPVVGPLIGMVVCSFACAYWAEWYRLKKVEHAIHIAWGAVTARIAVIIVKMTATLGMSLYLFIRMAL